MYVSVCLCPQELEFQTSPQTAIEALIHINNQLRQPEAAVGVLTYAQVSDSMLTQPLCSLYILYVHTACTATVQHVHTVQHGSYICIS